MHDPETFTKELRSLITPVNELAQSLLAVEKHAESLLRSVEPEHLPSARNLLHYLALRRHDLRELQDRLATLGLSSLGRSEPCVEATLTGVLELLERGTGVAPSRWPRELVTLDEGRRRLQRSTERLLGRPRAQRRVRILVTMPTEATSTRCGSRRSSGARAN